MWKMALVITADKAFEQLSAKGSSMGQCKKHMTPMHQQ